MYADKIWGFCSILTVNSILGGGTNPPSIRKIREKNDKCNKYNFLKVLSKSKSSWTTFKKNFETLSSRLSRDHYWRGGMQEIHDFRGF